MTDELASALMKVSGLRVAAHSSTFTFKGKPADAREVGSKLHVASVLEDTMRRAGSKLRITAQLVNASDGLALWSERYERESKDVFKVQDDITSLDYFSQALAKDRNYALVYDGISYAWTWLADAFVAPREAYPKANVAAMTALELDPTDSDAPARRSA